MKTRRTIAIKGVPVHLDLDTEKMSQRIIADFLDERPYEQETVRVLESVLKPGDTFIDVGAHVGYFSVIAAALVGRHGRVWALEPDPLNFKALVENIELNGANVFPLRLAAGPFQGYMDFFTNLDNDGGHAFWDVGMHEFNQRSRATPARRQVHVLPVGALPCKGAVVIKIDTEGAEAQVLNGATDLLALPDTTVICEINRFGLAQMGSSEEQLWDLMEVELGYRAFVLEPDSEKEPVPVAPGESFDSGGVVFNMMFRKDA
jgi:FkbM family methyltransferase